MKIWVRANNKKRRKNLPSFFIILCYKVWVRMHWNNVEVVLSIQEYLLCNIHCKSRHLQYIGKDCQLLYLGKRLVLVRSLQSLIQFRMLEYLCNIICHLLYFHYILQYDLRSRQSICMNQTCFCLRKPSLEVHVHPRAL